MIVGITGMSGSGKSSICEKVSKILDFIVIDADKVVKKLQNEDSDYLKEIVSTFGKSILVNGVLDRKKLANIVFNDRLQKEKLDKLTFKYVSEEIEKIIEKNKERNILLDAPLLIEAGYKKFCDIVIYVKASRKEQINRICKRDGIDSNSAIMRINAQKDDDFYSSNSNYSVVNDNLDDAVNEVVSIIRSLN